MLVAGGVGITPFHNIFFTLYHEVLARGGVDAGDVSSRKRVPAVELWWINRSANAFSYYIESFRQFQQAPVQRLKIKLFATRERSRSSVASDSALTAQSSYLQRNRSQAFAITWDAQRPYLPTALSFMKEYRHKGLLYVCGPKSMVDDCLLAAYQNKNHFKREYFLW